MKARMEGFIDCVNIYPKLFWIYMISCLSIIPVLIVCIIDIHYKFDFWILMALLIIPPIILTGIFYLIYLFMRSQVRQIRFERYILNKSMFSKYHHEQNLQLDIMKEFINELYWSSKCSKIKEIITEFDDSIFKVDRRNHRYVFIYVHMEGELFCTFKICHDGEIVTFYLAKTNPLYEDCNEKLCNEN